MRELRRLALSLPLAVAEASPSSSLLAAKTHTHSGKWEQASETSVRPW